MKTLAQVFSGIVKPYIDAEDEKVLTNMAPVEESPATAAHVVGAQIIYNDVLYEVIDAIAIDDPLVIYPTTGANIKAADDITMQIKNHTVTTDATPTANSTNPVQSGGVFTSEQNIYAVMGKNGAKNLLAFARSAGSYEDGKLIVNADNSITIDGTFSDVATFNLDYVTGASDAITDVAPLIGQQLIANILDTEETGITFKIGYFDSSNARVNITEVATSDTFSYPSGAVKSSNYLRVAAGTYSNVTVFPMIRYASDTDETYQPFAKTNKQLTDEQGYITDSQYTAIQSLLNS